FEDDQLAGDSVVRRLARVAAVTRDLDLLAVDVKRPVRIARPLGGGPAREGEGIAENVHHAALAETFFEDLEIVLPGWAASHGRPAHGVFGGVPGVDFG